MTVDGPPRGKPTLLGLLGRDETCGPPGRRLLVLRLLGRRLRALPAPLEQQLAPFLRAFPESLRTRLLARRLLCLLPSLHQTLPASLLHTLPVAALLLPKLLAKVQGALLLPLLKLTALLHPRRPWPVLDRPPLRCDALRVRPRAFATLDRPGLRGTGGRMRGWLCPQRRSRRCAAGGRGRPPFGSGGVLLLRLRADVGCEDGPGDQGD